ncbi:MAG: DNA polymerase III subunit delta' [Anaerolineales bacterium]
MPWDFLGNEWAVEHLRKHASDRAPRHAYLIFGPAGIGRRTLALRFAMALNCTQPTLAGDACGMCRACSLLAKMQHPDLEVVQANQAAGQLKVDQIRELQHRLALAPYEARYRIALLLNFERANASAANALLKTLEEPPERVILILTADSPESLLPTIVSRCEGIRLRPVEMDYLAALLISRLGISAEQAQLLSHLSNGCPGLAIQLHDEPHRIAEWQAGVQAHLHLLTESWIERFALAEHLAKEKDRQRLMLTLQCWLSFWRDVLISSNQASSSLTNINLKEEISNTAQKITWQQAFASMSAIQKTITLLDSNVNTRLALENLMLQLPQL